MREFYVSPTELEPVSFRRVISSIGRANRRHCYEASIMQSPDDIFTATNQALKAKQNDLKQKEKGNRP